MRPEIYIIFPETTQAALSISGVAVSALLAFGWSIPHASDNAVKARKR